MGKGSPGAGVQGLSPRAKRVIEVAIGEATRLGHSFVGTEHLLMGILREPGSAAARIISSTGADLNAIYTDLLQSLGGRSAGRERPTASAAAPGRAEKRGGEERQRAVFGSLDGKAALQSAPAANG